MNGPATPHEATSRAKNLRTKARAQTDQELKRLLLQQAEQIETEISAQRRPEEQAD